MTVTADLTGRRVLVVGASSGIGRAVATEAVRAGASVVFSARRRAALDAAVSAAGGGFAIAGDISLAAEAPRIVSEAVGVLGGLDLVFVSVGVSPLVPFATTTPEDWRDVLETNVVGIHQIIRAAIPHLASHGVVAAVSSETVGQPRPYVGVYAASKAALEESLRTWRTEHPNLRFACVTVGGTAPTEFADAFDPEFFGQALTEWVNRGLIQQEQMDTSELGGTLVQILAAALAHPGIGLEQLTLRAPSAPMAPIPPP
jgi:NAD(P)-dependent dehydrogenase (short-subunit alcohol dehydrogenase family)